MKDQLLNLAQIRYDTVPVGDLKVRVREAGTTEFSEYASLGSDQTDEAGKVTRKGDKEKANAYLIASCVVDENDSPVFTVEEALTLAKSARVSLPLMNKIMELSGLKEEAEKHPDAG